MELDENDLREFMQIWQDEFHESISLEDARRSASLLAELYLLLVRAVPEALSESSKNSSPNYGA